MLLLLTVRVVCQCVFTCNGRLSLPGGCLVPVQHYRRQSSASSGSDRRWIDSADYHAFEQGNPGLALILWHAQMCPGCVTNPFVSYFFDRNLRPTSTNTGYRDGQEQRGTSRLRASWIIPVRLCPWEQHTHKENNCFCQPYWKRVPIDLLVQVQFHCTHFLHSLWSVTSSVSSANFPLACAGIRGV